jgi:hypothetical protein
LKEAIDTLSTDIHPTSPGAHDAAHLPVFLETALAGYTDRLQDVFGRSLLGVTVFGPVVAGEADASMDFLRSVVVLDDVDLNALRRLSQEGRRLAHDQIAAPLIMTPGYIESSLDSFPLELIEIQSTGRTVVGTDFFTRLAFQDEHIRLQCERELKSVLIMLRQGVLASAGRDDFLTDVEVEAAQALGRTIRGLMWIRGERKLASPLRLLDALERLTGRHHAGLRAALVLEADHGWTEFTAMYRDVLSLMELSDAW